MVDDKVRAIMNLREEWRDALRGGKYAQGKNRLSNDFQDFCCLGVAEDSLGPLLECPISRKYEAGAAFFADCEEVIRGTDLHISLRKALGLSEEQQRILMTLNDGVDGENASFNMIANVLFTMNIYCDGKIYSEGGHEIATYTETGSTEYLRLCRHEKNEF